MNRKAIPLFIVLLVGGAILPATATAAEAPSGEPVVLDGIVCLDEADGNPVCRTYARRLATSIGICALGSLGWFAAARLVRAAATAIRVGVHSFSGIIAGLFCWDIYETFWDWQLCKAGGMMRTDGSTGVAVDSATANEVLAKELEKVARKLDRRIRPELDEEERV